jgi:hypothetical protein
VIDKPMSPFDLAIIDGMRAEAPSDRATARRRANPPPVERRAGRLVVLLAAILAFLWQGYVTHAHVHPARQGMAASARVLPGHAASGHSKPDTPDNCPICQAVAQAGHYLLPTAIAFRASPSQTEWHIVTLTPPLTRNDRSHSWQSRAPPQPFQA